LLAVLPCSIVMSESLQWLRDCLLRTGAIRYVHELPPRTFPNVESRMYLFVFDKGKTGKGTVLCNHDLIRPERLTVEFRATDRGFRLDFAFNRANRELQKLVRLSRLGWRSLGDLATVIRGSVDSPHGPRGCVHTCDFRNGFWRIAGRHRPSTAARSDGRVRWGDILAKRVGRDCCQSFGRAIGLQGVPCSDCILLLRPRSARDSTRVLFCIRCLLGMEWAKSLVEKGTGASYITANTLSQLVVPALIWKVYPSAFREFRSAVASRSQRGMSKAVAEVCRQLVRAGKLLTVR
jgi:hypothetical protein